MVARKYIPNKGDIVWLNFGPSTGHEQKGQRPAVVLSGSYFNERSGVMWVCPITSKSKNYSFEVPIVERKIEGVILVDHLKSVDWLARNARKVDSVSVNCINEVIKKAMKILS